jgi:O-antigen/teichoic acid export membrane protein
MAVLCGALWIWGLYANEKTSVVLYITAIAAVLSLALNSFMAPKYGAIGVSFTNLSVELVVLALAIFLSSKTSKIKKNDQSVAAEL